MPFSQSDLVSQAIREHQQAVGNWDYSPIATELHRWVELFDLEFKLELPSYSVLLFRPLRNAYATYGCFRNEVGTRDNITLHKLKWAQDELLSWSGGLTRLLPRDGVWLGPQRGHRDWSMPIQVEAPRNLIGESHITSLALALAQTLDQGEIYYQVQPVWRLPGKKSFN